MYEQNTSMVAANEQNKFLLPAMVEGDFSRDEIAEDADGLQMMSFQRVKIPAGGALQFEVPTEDPDNPDYTRALEGIILYNHSAYTLWPEGSEYDEDTKPLCSSVDSGTEDHRWLQEGRARTFEKRTGILLEFNQGIDTAYYKNDWHCTAPICEIVCCDFAGTDTSAA